MRTNFNPALHSHSVGSYYPFIVIAKETVEGTIAQVEGPSGAVIWSSPAGATPDARKANYAAAFQIAQRKAEEHRHG